MTKNPDEAVVGQSRVQMRRLYTYLPHPRDLEIVELRHKSARILIQWLFPRGQKDADVRSKLNFGLVLASLYADRLGVECLGDVNPQHESR